MVSWDDPQKRSLFGRDVSDLLPPLPPPKEADGQMLLFGRPVTKPAPPRRKASKAMQAKKDARRRRDVPRLATPEDDVWHVCDGCPAPDECETSSPRVCKVFGF